MRFFGTVASSAARGAEVAGVAAAKRPSGLSDGISRKLRQIPKNLSGGKLQRGEFCAKKLLGVFLQGSPFGRQGCGKSSTVNLRGFQFCVENILETDGKIEKRS